MARFERIYTKKYRKLLSKYARKSSEAYEIAGRRGVDIVVTGFALELKPILYKNIIGSYNAFGKLVIDEFNDNKKEVLNFRVLIQDYLRDFGLAKITQIDETTKDDIFTIISEGESEGDPIASIAKKIKELGKGIARHRAQTIAITETHSAASYGSRQAAKSTGLTLKKEWAAAEDSRTRQSHNDADGQKVDMDKKFKVGNSRLMYPGDPSAPAKEIISCRCVELYNEI